jgi:L-lactate dehydrogenase
MDEARARPKKVAIIGAGNIGKELWKELTEKGAADEIVVQNRSNNWDNEAFKGTMIAVDQANLIRNKEGRTTQFTFTTDMREALEGEDIVVITAGVARKSKDQPRAELLEANCAVIDPIAQAAREIAPNANYVIATNPVDAMTQRFQERSGIAPEQVLGLSGELDRVRMVQSICNQTGVSPDCVKNANVIGQHGEAMVPVVSGVMIHKPGQEPQRLVDILADQPERLQEIRDAAIKGGARLVERLKTSDHIAPAAALESMVMNIIDAKYNGKDAPVMHASALSREEGVYIGQPVKAGKNGKHDVLPLPELDWTEKAGWEKSVKASHAVLADIPGREQARRIA